MRAKQCVRHGWNRAESRRGGRCDGSGGGCAGILAADKDSGAVGLRDVRALSDTSERIQRLARRVRGFPPREICFERARLMTESYRRTAGEPAIVRKAKAFYAVADGLPLQIEPGEWLVGNIASRPRVALLRPGELRLEPVQTGDGAGAELRSGPGAGHPLPHSRGHCGLLAGDAAGRHGGPFCGRLRQGAPPGLGGAAPRWTSAASSIAAPVRSTRSGRPSMARFIIIATLGLPRRVDSAITRPP